MPLISIMGNTSKTILLVEDDADIERLVTFRLSREGYTVRHAPDGEQALQDLEGSPLPDLIILDVMLPILNGFEVLSQIRKTPRLSAIPVIMLTANSREEDVLQGLRHGADDYLTKPFRPAELVARVQGMLRRS